MRLPKTVERFLLSEKYCSNQTGHDSSEHGKKTPPEYSVALMGEEEKSF